MKWALKWASIFFLLPNPIFIGEHLLRGTMLAPAPHMHDLHPPGTLTLGVGQDPAVTCVEKKIGFDRRKKLRPIVGPISTPVAEPCPTLNVSVPGGCKSCI